MDLSYLEQIIKLFEGSTLTELEIDEEGSRITLSRAKEQPIGPGYGVWGMGYPAPPAQTPNPDPQIPSASIIAPTSAKTHEVKSPIVGTLYRAPAPDADPYVQVGQHVSEGTTLCIIEAMKLMNEIESDATGKIVKILVENGQPVEYGQPLFVLEVD
jgi:acetyl-CoA carboxylase biotin carboxyl carrier protein